MGSNVGWIPKILHN